MLNKKDLSINQNCNHFKEATLNPLGKALAVIFGFALIMALVPAVAFATANITIYYKASTGGSVSSETETLDSTTGTTIGSSAVTDENYMFVNWTDQDGVEVSTDTQLIPQKTEEGVYKQDIYTANFKVADSYKGAALKNIDTQVIAATKAINELTFLNEEEVETLKLEISTAQQSIQEAVEEAETVEEVDNMEQEGLTSIMTIENTASEKNKENEQNKSSKPSSDSKSDKSSSDSKSDKSSSDSKSGKSSSDSSSKKSSSSKTGDDNQKQSTTSSSDNASSKSSDTSSKSSSSKTGDESGLLIFSLIVILLSTITTAYIARRKIQKK